ncbi:hypothetical protein, partial [Aeromonas veronii]|uniref:hypothetical protein n=1 Tax=Aeromonas veronii TaxID=654 RepID=UPI0038B49364
IKQVGVTAGSGISAILVTWIAGTRLGWEAGFLVAGGVAFLVAGIFASVYREETGTGTISIQNPRELFGQSD